MGSDWGYLRLPDKRFLFVSCFRDPRVCMSIDSITFAHPCSGLSENIPRFKAKNYTSDRDLPGSRVVCIHRMYIQA